MKSSFIQDEWGRYEAEPNPPAGYLTLGTYYPRIPQGCRHKRIWCLYGKLENVTPEELAAVLQRDGRFFDDGLPYYEVRGKDFVIHTIPRRRWKGEGPSELQNITQCLVGGGRAWRENIPRFVLGSPFHNEGLYVLPYGSLKRDDPLLLQLKAEIVERRLRERDYHEDDTDQHNYIATVITFIPAEAQWVSAWHARLERKNRLALAEQRREEDAYKLCKKAQEVRREFGKYFEFGDDQNTVLAFEKHQYFWWALRIAKAIFEFTGLRLYLTPEYLWVDAHDNPYETESILRALDPREFFFKIEPHEGMVGQWEVYPKAVTQLPDDQLLDMIYLLAIRSFGRSSEAKLSISERNLISGGLAKLTTYQRTEVYIGEGDRYLSRKVDEGELTLTNKGKRLLYVMWMGSESRRTLERVYGKPCDASRFNPAAPWA